MTPQAGRGLASKDADGTEFYVLGWVGGDDSDESRHGDNDDLDHSDDAEIGNHVADTPPCAVVIVALMKPTACPGYT